MTSSEQNKFEAIVKEIIAQNPDIETSKELLKVLDYHIRMKATMQTAINYAIMGVN